MNLRLDEMNGRDPTKPLEADSSLGDLFSQLSSDLGSFVSTQVELAKLEIRDEAMQIGKAGGLLGAGFLAAVLAIALLSVAAAWGLATVMPTAVGFLIVGALWAVAAAILAVSGRSQLRNVRFAPPETKQSLKEGMQWAQQLKS